MTSSLLEAPILRPKVPPATIAAYIVKIHRSKVLVDYDHYLQRADLSG